MHYICLNTLGYLICLFNTLTKDLHLFHHICYIYHYVTLHLFIFISHLNFISQFSGFLPFNFYYQIHATATQSLLKFVLSSLRILFFCSKPGSLDSVLRTYTTKSCFVFVNYAFQLHTRPTFKFYLATNDKDHDLQALL